MDRPVIGLVPLYDLEQHSYWMLPDYLHSVEDAGGIPVILPPMADSAALNHLLSRLDGLIFTGGQDVAPALYGQEPAPGCGTICPERDALDTSLLKAALELDLPVLGICRGIQLINAALGGTLWQDLPTEHPSDLSHRMERPYDQVAHEVRLLPQTPLADLLRTEALGVNSCHHQAIRDLSPRLKAMAVTPDGLVEAAYDPDRRFFWAVQWHPEMSYDANAASRRIFSAFVEACAGRSAEPVAPAANPEQAPLGFYGSQTLRLSVCTPYPSIRTPQDLYKALLHCWTAGTCASRMRSHWSPDNPTLGQCSITAFLAQDLFGGRVYGIPLPGGFFHCYNEVDGQIFDLTSEQFGEEILNYRKEHEQYRAVHFAMPEKEERYGELKANLERYLSEAQK